MGRSKNRRRRSAANQRRRRQISNTLGLSISEFCRQENVSRTTFYEWVKQGRAPDLLRPSGPGGWSRVTPEAVAAWRNKFSGQPGASTATPIPETT
jgi:transposase-like protein